MITTTFIQGMAIGGSLIIAIGAQNAFVLTQGLKRQYPLTIAATCALVDTALIFLGTIGVGHLISQQILLQQIARYAGALFLFVYGLRAFYNILRNQHLDKSNKPGIYSYKQAILASLGFSLLNPHVYLDTVVLLGSISAQFQDSERVFFASGAILASVLWFFCLAFGAKWLAPLFKKTIAWKILDGLIGLIMWSIAWTLIFNA